MSEMRAIPGDPWIICDRCGFKTRMSASRKTWDGLRVCLADWEPKHPLLSIKGKVDRQAVYDGRPESPDKFVECYSLGTFCLISPNRTRYIVTVADDGAMLITPGVFGEPVSFLTLGDFRLSVGDDGTVSATPSPTPGLGPLVWRMHSPSELAYGVIVTGDGAVIMTLMPHEDHLP